MKKLGYGIVSLLLCCLALTPAKDAQALGTELRLKVVGTSSPVAGVDATIILPAGVTVSADSDGLLAPQVLSLAGNATSGLSVGMYTPATADAPATVVVGVIHIPGFAAGDFAALTLNVAPGIVPTSGQFSVSAKIIDANDSTIPGASVSATVQPGTDLVPPSTTATPPGGTYTSTQAVTLKSNESGPIYYTTNGSTPTTASSVYSGPISISSPTTLRYLAVDPSGNTETAKSASFAFTPVVSLAVAGTGSGAVTCTPPGLATNTGTSTQLPYGTALVLKAAPAEYSIFKGWSGGVCSGTADCGFSLTKSVSVTATINRDLDHQIRIEGQPLRYFPTLLAAFNAASASGTVIKAWGVAIAEKLVVTGNKSVTFEGGYNGGYTSNGGSTTLTGSLTIAGGSVTVENLVIL